MLMNVWIFIGCTKSKHSLPNSYGKMIADLKVDEVVVPFHENSLGLKSYSTTTCWEMDSVSAFVGYNHYTHSLDFFSLTEGEMLRSIQLSKEGPDGVFDKVCSIYPYKEDSIWIYDHVNFYLIDSKGCVRKKLFFGDVDLIKVETNHRMHTAKFAYNPHRHSLSILVAKDKGFAVNEYSVENGRIMHEFHLQPSVCNVDGDRKFADMNCPNISFSDKKIIYNYPYESTIYVLNLQTKEHLKFGAASQYCTNIAGECSNQNDYSAWERYGMVNTHFFDVMYLYDRKVYVRPHLNGVEYNTNKSLQELGDSRDLYLMFFDENFQIIGEFKMKDRTYSYFTAWCALSNGLLLFKDNSLSEIEEYDKMLVDIIKIP